MTRDAAWWKPGHGWAEPTIRPVYLAWCEACDWASTIEYRDSLAALRAVDRHLATSEQHRIVLENRELQLRLLAEIDAEREEQGMV